MEFGDVLKIDNRQVRRRVVNSRQQVSTVDRENKIEVLECVHGQKTF